MSVITIRSHIDFQQDTQSRDAKEKETTRRGERDKYREATYTKWEKGTLPGKRHIGRGDYTEKGLHGEEKRDLYGHETHME